jgi:WD40 repeat protein
MGRARSEPPARTGDAGTDPTPRWLAEVVPTHPAPPPPSASYVTVVHSGAPAAPIGGHPLLDFMKVGSEIPGRYVYLSPDGERGAELGRGGIGRVLVAMDDHVGREVAIKELLVEPGESASAPDPEMASRFLAEARITGQLEHPNIVPVYELGRRTDGRLYYTMRVVRGETMSAVLERAQSLPARLALLSHFAGLCNAIAYAHSRGVVHRDIKPDNVMIGEFGETIVLDWGIAKVKGQPEMPGARAPRGIGFIGETLHGDLVGTPLFMSPEQARGDVDQIDEASDVWSLGVVLFVLLAGRPPFLGKTTDEVVKRVIEARPAPVQKLEPLAPPELCAVVERALSREKQQRYPSVRELAADISAFMSGARVGAYDYSSFELLRRFYRKHRAAAIVGAVAVLSLLVVATELSRRILWERDRALLAEQDALEKERVARQSLAEVFTERALNASLEGDVVNAELYAARALISGERPDARGSVVAGTNRHEVVPLGDDAGFSSCAPLVSSGNGAVACARERDVFLWSVNGPSSRLRVAEAPVQLALSGDGKTLLTAFADGRFVTYDTQNQTPRAQFRAAAGEPPAFALSEDGSRFLTSAESGFAQLWDTASAQPIARISLGEPVTQRALSPSGRRVVLGGRLGALLIWEPESGQRIQLEGHRGTVTAAAFSRRDDMLASAGSDRTLSLWNALTGKRLAPPLRDLGTPQSIAWAPDGLTLAFGSDDRMLGLVDARHPNYAERVRGHPGAVLLASFAGPERLISVGPQIGLRQWSFAHPRLPRELSHKSNVLATAFVSAEQLATAGLAQEGVCLWQIAEERCKTRLPVRDGQVRALSVHAASHRLAVGTSLGLLTVWNLVTALPEHVILASSDQIRSLEFAADGRTLLSAGTDGSALLWDLASGQSIQRFAAGVPLQDAILDSARSRVVFGTRNGELELWGLDGKKQGSLQAHADWIMDLAHHPASDRLASAGGNGEITFWALDTLQKLGSVQAHEGRVSSIEFSPAGDLLVSAGEDGIVNVWHAGRREHVAKLVHHRGVARSVRFSPDGKFIASGGDDASVRLWDLSRLNESGQSLLEKAER